MMWSLLFILPVQADEIMAGTRYLRSVSLDLLGRGPTMEEYELIEDGGDIPPDLLEQWLQSPEFADRVARFHRSLLWNNVGDPLLQSRDFQLRKNDDILWIDRRADSYRGGDYRQEQCGDFAATLDADGVPIATNDEYGVLREGWVEVAPYWDVTTTVKVCAFDAQETRYSSLGVDCRSFEGQYDPECGCGPDLSWCFYPTEDTMETVSQAFGQQIDQHVRHMITEQNSYLQLLTGDEVLVNGPLVHFYKHQLASPQNIYQDYPPIDPEVLPDLQFTDEDVWVSVPAVTGASGILTLPGFLLRFMTNRARSNRFNTAFLCDEFIGPEGGLPADDGGALMPDLTQREGCDYCHARLEPMAAYWGRWSEQGASYLSPEMFPAYDQNCYTCGIENDGCNNRCNDYYVVDAWSDVERDWIGWLGSYQFLQDRYHSNVENGPIELVMEGVYSGQLQSCVVGNALHGLLGREASSRDEQWRQQLEQHFVASNFSYAELIKGIVTSEQYRRLP